jgi:hypothetical protein
MEHLGLTPPQEDIANHPQIPFSSVCTTTTTTVTVVVGVVDASAFLNSVGGKSD